MLKTWERTGMCAAFFVVVVNLGRETWKHVEIFINSPSCGAAAQRGPWPPHS